MNLLNELRKISNINNGVIETSDFSMLKISDYRRRKLIDEGVVDKITLKGFKCLLVMCGKV